jgi:MYXO-CTERM domain-containing protein
MRKNFTDLDFAAMQDIGWQVTPVPEAGTWAMMLSGLVLVGGMSRRRSGRL